MIESRPAIAVCSALCLLLAGWSLTLRHKAEASNKAVGLMLESSVIESLVLVNSRNSKSASLVKPS